MEKSVRLVRKVVMRHLLLGVTLVLAGCTPTPKTAREDAHLPELPFAHELQDALDHALQSSQGDHDLGISAAVIVPGYRPWSGVSGNSHPGVPVTPDMVFDAGSIAKNFEAALVLELAEQGLLNLDDPISRWLPAYHNVDPGISIRQLLNHTSGIFNVHEHPDLPWVGPDIDYAKTWQTEEVFTTFVLEPYGPPGAVQHYSSTNYLLLTAVIEAATGASPPEQVELYFLDPFGLEHTLMTMGEPPPARFSVAHPWADMDRDGKLDDLYGIPSTWRVSLTHPAILTSPGDLALWSQALYHDRSVLSPDSLREMLEVPEEVIPDPEGGKYGLGVVDYSDVLGMQVIGHGGSAPGYSAAMAYLPEYGASIAWLVNTGESPRELADTIMWNTWSFLSEVLRMQLEPSKPERRTTW